MNPGDVVVLKSGSLPMTVAATLENGNIECEWMNENNQPQVAAFRPTSLEPFVEPTVEVS